MTKPKKTIVVQQPQPIPEPTLSLATATRGIGIDAGDLQLAPPVDPPWQSDSLSVQHVAHVAARVVTDVCILACVVAVTVKLWIWAVG